jgi:hypothetical protein
MEIFIIEVFCFYVCMYVYGHIYVYIYGFRVLGFFFVVDHSIRIIHPPPHPSS